MVLFIDACVRGEQSRTKALSVHFLRSYARLHPDEEVETVRVDGGRFLPLTCEDLAQRDAQAQAWQQPMFDAARLFARADKIVIAAPYWDLSFPAALKCYLEHISVCGITFRYVPEGVLPLCKADSVLYITTAGGKMAHANHGYTYIQGLFGSMFGVARQHCVAAELLDVEGQDIEGILSAARRELEDFAGKF